MALSEHLEKLRHFQRLAGYRSLREGAQAMGLSQAGLSKSIAALESVLETQLFFRTPEGLVLTKEGKEVLTTSANILEQAANLETKLRTLKVSSTPSTFKIGMYDSIAVYFFSELEAYLGALYPEVDLRLTVDNSQELSRLVSQGELDIAIGVNLSNAQNGTTNFVKLFDEYYSFYISSRHEIDVNNTPFLIHGRADDLQGKTVEIYLRSVLKKRRVHKVFNFETLKTLTLQGLGIGVLPTQVAKPLVKKGSLVSVQIPMTKHLFGQHDIGFLATSSFLKSHGDFAEDIYRLGDRWSKT